MTNQIYYTKENVEEAQWILGTSSYLNHGLPALLWAAKINIWYTSLLAYISRHFNDIDCFERNLYSVLRRVKEGRLNFKDTP